MAWKKVTDGLPESEPRKRGRKRYMAYSPKYQGYVFRCWYNNGFGCDSAQTMVSDVTHYRPAKKSEKCHQLNKIELAKIA